MAVIAVCASECRVEARSKVGKLQNIAGTQLEIPTEN
jgi:hypothetical protein